MTGYAAANFLLTRREEDLAWMSLVGVIANSTRDDAQHAHERIAIGVGTEHLVAAAGYLYTFANDAWGFYGHQPGQRAPHCHQSCVTAVSRMRGGPRWPSARSTATASWFSRAKQSLRESPSNAGH